MKIKLLLSMCFLWTLIGSGCKSSGDAVRVEQDYGNSVRQMVQAQIYDPDAAALPNPEPPLSMDGIKASNTLESYREDIGKPKSTETPALIQIDTGN